MEAPTLKILNKVFPQLTVLDCLYKIEDREVISTKNDGGEQFVVKKGNYNELAREYELTTNKLPNNIKKYAPKLIELKKENDVGLILMEMVPGKRLDLVWDMLNDSEIKRVKENIRKFMTLMKENTTTLSASIVREHFSSLLKESPYKKYILEGVIMNEYISQLIRGEFCHNDLHSCNIIVDEKMDIRIIDWEAAGYFPKWWEYYNYENLITMNHLWKYIITDCCMGKPDFSERRVYFLAYANNRYMNFGKRLEIIAEEYKDI